MKMILLKTSQPEMMMYVSSGADLGDRVFSIFSSDEKSLSPWSSVASISRVFNTIGTSVSKGFILCKIPRTTSFMKYNSQRLNRRNRGVVLVSNWSKEVILIKDCRD